MNINQRRELMLELEGMGLRTEAEKIICPIVPKQITERDIELARLKYVQERLLDDLWGICIDEEHKKYTTAAETKEELTKILRYEDTNFQKYLQYWDDWDLTNQLDSWHDGDCVAVACTCMRCYAENMFGFSTCKVGKNIGNKMFLQFNKEVNERHEYINNKGWMNPLTLEQEITLRMDLNRK